MKLNDLKVGILLRYFDDNFVMVISVVRTIKFTEFKLLHDGKIIHRCRDHDFNGSEISYLDII